MGGNFLRFLGRYFLYLLFKHKLTQAGRDQVALFWATSGLLVCVCYSVSTSAADKPIAVQARVLSFTEWKTQQVSEAESRLSQLQNKQTLTQAERRALNISADYENELQSARQILEVTKEFTIEHYTASYVRPLMSSKNSLKDLTRTLSSDELAEVLYIIGKNSNLEPHKHHGRSSTAPWRLNK